MVNKIYQSDAGQAVASLWFFILLRATGILASSGVCGSCLAQAYFGCPFAVPWALKSSAVTSPPDQQYSHQ